MKFDATITDLFDLDIPESYEIPECLPLMALRDVIVFPSMVVPLFVGRESSIAAVNEALTNDRLIFLVAQKDARIDKPLSEDLYSTGVIAAIMRTLQLPDGRLKILTQALLKGRTLDVVQQQPFFKVKVEPIEDQKVEISVETEALMRHVREQAEKLFNIKNVFSPELGIILSTVNDPGKLADVVASNLKLNAAEAQEILQLFHPIERLKKVSEFLSREIEVSAVQAKIQSEAREEMSRTQRDIFLREQLRAIQKELGEIDERQKEIDEYKAKIEQADMPEHAEEEALKQLRRLEFMHPDSSEAALVRTYLDWLCELPWTTTTRDKLDIKRARKVLDEDHYDLEKIKERIIEFIAVRKLNRGVKGPILCFVGPPGVGKTSLGKSIARALGRKFARLSLGGVRDEAEIRGHRRTYVGAMPGRIIQEIKRARTKNPVFMIDEVDKIGTDFRGDPAAALLEVLDPEQNNAFSDHYIEVPFDLSKVLFILTANVIDTIPSALLDRLELLRLSGYTPEEKMEIAKRYLIARQMKECGLKQGQLEISDNALSKIISEYTEEAGLRELERQIAAVCRKVACKVAEGDTGPFRLTAGNLHKYLGPPKVLSDFFREDSQVGVATGLAWTAYGGEVMRIECQIMPGKGNLTLTGLLGEVMKESAQAALSWIKSRADKLGIDSQVFEEKDVHIHIPSGAIPKDGPSAGITLTTALVSAFTKRPVNKDVAMTGEITLTGRVLPIGGLKEKSIAALRKSISTIIIPESNMTDLDEVPEQIRRQLEFKPVKTMDEVLDIALLPEHGSKERVKKKDV